MPDRTSVNPVVRLSDVKGYVEWVLALPAPRTNAERKIWYAYELGKVAQQ